MKFEERNEQINCLNVRELWFLQHGGKLKKDYRRKKV